MKKKELEEMSKEELVEMVLELQEQRGLTEEDKERMEEESFQNEAYMERHGRIDYGYGIGAYGPL